MRDPEFAYRKPSKQPPKVSDAKTIPSRGPWVTKAGAELSVAFAFPQTDVSDYFSYDEEELAMLPENIKGLRCYKQRGLKRGTEGGGEFHRIRKELLFVFEGALDMEIEDVYGDRRHCILNPESGLYLPPFLLHSFTTLKDSMLFVVANTLFNPENRLTHDSYSREAFEALKKQYI